MPAKLLLQARRQFHLSKVVFLKKNVYPYNIPGLAVQLFHLESYERIGDEETIRIIDGVHLSILRKVRDVGYKEIKLIFIIGVR